MKIKCPDCKTSYDIKPEILGKDGRSVKCVRCGNRWFVRPKSASAEEDDAGIDEDMSADAAEWAADEADEDRAADEKGVAGSEDSDFEEVVAEETEEVAEEPSEDDNEDDFPASTEQPARKPPAFELDEDEEDEGDDEGAGASEPPTDIETLAKRPKIKVNPNKFKKSILGAILRWLSRRNYRRLTGMILFGTAVAMCAFLVLIRDQIVKQAPDLASLFELVGMDVNLRGLEFRDLRTFSEVQDGKKVLVVEGTIRNISKENTPVPAVRLSIRGTDLQEIYAWTVEPRTTILKGLDETRFRTILSDPPAGAADIHVRFIDRGRRKVVLQ